MTAGSIDDLRVVVTRAAPQAESLIAAIEERNGRPIALALLEILDAADDGAALRQVMSRATAKDWLVVFSPNGASRLTPGPFPGKVAAIASGTARALAERGYDAELIPRIPSSVGLLEAFTDIVIGGQVIVVQAENGRQDFPEGMRARGVEVEAVSAYRNVMPELDPEVSELARAADVVVFASPSAVKRYVAHVGLSPRPAVCIGEVTAGEAKAAGYDVVVAAAPDVEAIMARLIELHSRLGEQG